MSSSFTLSFPLSPSHSSHVHQLLEGCLSPDNGQRTAAEKEITRLLDNQLEEMTSVLIYLLRHSNIIQVRSLIAILLRRHLPTGEPLRFDELTEQTQTAVKAELIHSLANEAERYVRSQVSDTVAELASILLYSDGWRELIPFLFQLMQQQQEEKIIMAINMFGKLTETPETLAAYLKEIRPLFRHAFSSPSLKVRECLCLAIMKIIAPMEDNKELTQYKEFIPLILQCVADVLNAGDQESAKRLLSGLVELADEEPEVFKTHLTAITTACIQMGLSNTLKDGVRQYCLELIVSLAEKCPQLFRKTRALIEQSLKLCLTFLLELNDDPNWFMKEEDATDFVGANFDAAEYALDRLSRAIKGPKFFPVFAPLFQEFAMNSDWRYRHAAFRALANVAEVFDFNRLPVAAIVQAIKDPHSRVRYAAILCVGQLADDFAGSLQAEYHAVLFPALIEPLKEVQHPRIQANAAHALFTLVDESEEIVVPYIAELMNLLVTLLKQGHRMVQEAVLPAIASIAGAASNEFQPYYPAVMSMIKQIIAQATSKELQSIRSRAMESGTFIGMRLGKEIFREDAKQLMAMFLDIINKGGLESDDVSEQYMLQACSRICSCLGEEFLPLMPVILPHVFKAAAATIDLNATGGGDDDEDECDDDGVMDPSAVLSGNRAVSTQLEDKSNACAMLLSFCHDLGPAFAPFVSATAEIMLPLVKFEYSEEIRQYAIDIMPDLIASVVQAHQQNPHAVTLDSVRAFFVRVIAALLECFTSEQNLDLLQVLVNNMQKCVSEAGDLARSCIPPEGVNLMGQALLKLLLASHERISQREARKGDAEVDEETLEEIEQDNLSEDRLNILVSDCLGTLMKSHEQAFMPTFELVLPELLRMLAPPSLDTTKTIAVFIYDDLIQYLQYPAARFFPQFMPPFIQYARAEDAKLRQAAGYGIGLCAEHGKDAFRPYLDASIAQLKAAIEEPNAFSEEYASATDNLVGALGKLAFHQGRPDLYAYWLDCLPIQADEQEGGPVYTMLVTLVENEEPNLMGANMANLPKILAVLASIFDSPFIGADEELNGRVLTLLLKMKTMPNDLMQQMLATLSKEQRDEIKEAFDNIEKI